MKDKKILEEKLEEAEKFMKKARGYISYESEVFRNQNDAFYKQNEVIIELLKDINSKLEKY